MGRRKKGGGCISVFFIILILGVISAALVVKFVTKTELGEKVKAVVGDPMIQTSAPEITVSEDSLDGRYYYSLLDEDEALGYKEILQGMQAHEEQIAVHYEDIDAVKKMVDYVMYDWPELFWCDGSGQVTSYGQMGQRYILLEPGYQYTKEDTERMQSEIDAAVNEWMPDLNGDGTEYGRIKAVYEYLINMTDYDLAAPDNQNIYSVFVNHKSVCAGYAKATQYLMNRLGIFCTYVTGTAYTEDGNAQAHAWNLVQCDGEYYYVDTTWGDPVFLKEENIPAGQNLINYDYLCCNDEEIGKTHVKDETAEFPESTSMRYNYYVLNGMYYEAYDRDSFFNAMAASIDNGQPFTAFKFSTASLYTQAHDVILGTLVKEAARYLCDVYGLSEVQYSYQEDSTMQKIVIYWNYE